MNDGVQMFEEDATNNGWVLASDGLLTRKAARVLAFDDKGRLYLVRGHDAGAPEKSWWFTIGGGIKGDEEPVQAARREFAEETGLDVSEIRFIGPVVKRDALFHFASGTRRQYETYYLLYLSDKEAEQLGENVYLTENESDVLDEFRWWDIYELEEKELFDDSVVVNPRVLPSLAERWSCAWDGECVEILEK